MIKVISAGVWADGAYLCDEWPEGLRYVGTAQEAYKQENDRLPRDIPDGWYCSEDNCTGNLAVGHVLRLTGRNGKDRYLAGVAYTDFAGVTLYPEVYGYKTHAAYAADDFAKALAEKEREMDEEFRRDEERETRMDLARGIEEEARDRLDKWKEASRQKLSELRRDCKSLPRSAKATRSLVRQNIVDLRRILAS
jgi:hypothetical protein